MAKYKSVNDTERVYPTLGIVVQPNDVVDLPDGTEAHGLMLVESVKATKKPSSEGEAE